MTPLLEIDNLSVSFDGSRGRADVLDAVSLTVARGEIFGLVGESGCGKSVTARAVPGLIPIPPGRITAGSIRFQGEDLLRVSPKRLRRLRGKEISMIFQEPMSSLNPVLTVGSQMREVVRIHEGLKGRAASALCADMLARVRMPDPSLVLKKFPHELSGGMRQRVMIAMALVCGPKLLIADEPTTALDVTVQGQVLAILTGLSREHGISVLLITHDMGVVAQVCDRVGVMYAGKMVETAPVKALFSAPGHPYTRGLIRSIPDMAGKGELASIPGSVPDLTRVPSGCRFHTRCGRRIGACGREVPGIRQVAPGHAVACHVPLSGKGGMS